MMELTYGLKQHSTHTIVVDVSRHEVMREKMYSYMKRHKLPDGSLRADIVFTWRPVRVHHHTAMDKL